MSNNEVQEVQEETDNVVGYNGAERVTGICIGTLYSLVAHKEIPHYRLSKRLVRFKVSELQAWMRCRRVFVPAAGESGRNTGTSEVGR